MFLEVLHNLMMKVNLEISEVVPHMMKLVDFDFLEHLDWTKRQEESHSSERA